MPNRRPRQRTVARTAVLPPSTRGELYALAWVTLLVLVAACLLAGTFARGRVRLNTPTLFVLMSGITVGAFALAIRMDARVVAVLGMLGGFLTPLFVGFAREQPLPLFGYVLVLNCGLLTVAKRQGWSFLIPLAAV